MKPRRYTIRHNETLSRKTRRCLITLPLHLSPRIDRVLGLKLFDRLPIFVVQSLGDNDLEHGILIPLLRAPFHPPPPDAELRVAAGARRNRDRDRPVERRHLHL